MNIPFSRSYWVQPGRVLAGCYPGGKESAEAEAKLTGLVNCGVTRVINLMEPNEVDHAGKPFIAYEPLLKDLAAQRNAVMELSRFPIVDCSVPTIAGMTRILDSIETSLALGQVVYLHCWGGRGRTGTVVACHLRRTRDLSGAAALALVSKLTEQNAAAFWPTPEMPCQREFVQAWEESK